MKVNKLGSKEKIEFKVRDYLKINVVRQYIDTYLANQRQGTSSTKTRSEVRGANTKIWQQKGTGRARHGHRYSNIFVGGGVAFGPKPKSWRKGITKGLKNASLVSIFNIKKDDLLVGVLPEFKKPSTKEAAKFLKEQDTKHLLIVLHKVDTNLIKSFSNLKGVNIVNVNQVNAFDVVSATKVIITENAKEKLEERLV